MNAPLPTDGPCLIPLEVTAFCDTHGLGTILTMQQLKGGLISTTHRLVTASGVSVILKHSATVPADLYQRERDGLTALAAVGQLRTPAIYAVGERFLLLEDCGTAPPRASYWERLAGASITQPTSARLRYWEELGHGLARQHQHTSRRFGFAHDNYQGLFVQHNPWMADGHAFFVQHRILQFLALPRCAHSLTMADRLALERFGERVRQLMPVQPAALVHGDLWIENLLVGPDSEPVVIDPAVYYGWPEVDLSAVQSAEVPEQFYAAYNEVTPLAHGWQERLEVLRITDHLSMVAHFGNQYGTVDKLRALLATYG